MWAPPVHLPVWQQDPTGWCSQLLQPSHQYRSQVAQRISDSHSHQARAKSKPLTLQMRKGRCCSPLPLTQPEQLSEPGLFSHGSLLTPHSCSSECSSSVCALHVMTLTSVCLYFCPRHMAYLSSPTRGQTPAELTVEAQSCNHWTTREFPVPVFLEGLPW